MKRNYILFYLLFFLFSCNSESFEIEEGLQLCLPKYPEQEIEISSHNYANSEVMDNWYKLSDGAIERNTRSIVTEDSVWLDGFGKTIKVQSDESVVLPNLHRFIYPGSILRGNSISDLNYKPITTAKIKPIVVSVSLPTNQGSATIDRPSLSVTRQFISDMIRQDNVGEQNATFNYSIEKFTSYHELKTAFGANVETGALFWNESSSTSTNERKISKQTGLYIKFVQRNFTLDMDLPVGTIIDGSLTAEETGGYSPVYVSSVAYGRLGILTLETDELSDYALSVVKETFRKVFVNKESTLTTEERRVIDNAVMKLYLIGGSGDTGVKTVTGVQAFINHISQGGTFTADNPGVPIYCSFSYLSDNSNVKTHFKYNITTDPLYVRLSFRDKHEISEGERYNETAYNVYLDFFNNRSGTTPTVPQSFIKFYLCKKELESDYIVEYDVVKKDVVTMKKREEYMTQNFYKESSMLVERDFVPYKQILHWSDCRQEDPYDKNCIYSTHQIFRLRVHTLSFKRLFYQSIPPQLPFDFHRGRLNRLSNGYWLP